MQVSTLLLCALAALGGLAEAQSVPTERTPTTFAKVVTPTVDPIMYGGAFGVSKSDHGVLCPDYIGFQTCDAPQFVNCPCAPVPTTSPGLISEKRQDDILIPDGLELPPIYKRQDPLFDCPILPAGFPCPEAEYILCDCYPSGPGLGDLPPPPEKRQALVHSDPPACPNVPLCDGEQFVGCPCYAGPLVNTPFCHDCDENNSKREEPTAVCPAPGSDVSCTHIQFKDCPCYTGPSVTDPSCPDCGVADVKREEPIFVCPGPFSDIACTTEQYKVCPCYTGPPVSDPSCPDCGSD